MKNRPPPITDEQYLRVVSERDQLKQCLLDLDAETENIINDPKTATGVKGYARCIAHYIKRVMEDK